MIHSPSAGIEKASAPEKKVLKPLFFMLDYVQLCSAASYFMTSHKAINNVLFSLGEWLHGRHGRNKGVFLPSARRHLDRETLVPLDKIGGSIMMRKKGYCNGKHEIQKGKSRFSRLSRCEK